MLITIISIMALVMAAGIATYMLANEQRPSKPEPFTPPEDVNTRGRPYSRKDWRLILPNAAVQELNLAFGENSEQTYRVRRAIELSIEHLMEELADDAECARIIEERLGSNPDSKTFNFGAH